jgi:hypothetical protein
VFLKGSDFLLFLSQIICEQFRVSNAAWNKQIEVCLLYKNIGGQGEEVGENKKDEIFLF